MKSVTCFIFLLHAAVSSVWSSDIDVQCSPEIVIKIPTNWSLEFPGTDSTLILGEDDLCGNGSSPKPSCKVQTINGSFYFHLKNIEDCGGVVESNENETRVVWEVKRYPNVIRNIRRARCGSFKVGCTYSFGSSPFSVGYPMTVNEIEASGSKQVFNEDYKYSLKVMRDRSYKEESCTSNVQLQQPIYLQAQVHQIGSTKLLLHAHNCYVTPVNDPYSSITYDIINSQGCADVYPGESAGVDLGVDSNFVSSTANFFFKSFVWTSRQNSLFIHCYATVCSESDQKCKQEIYSHGCMSNETSSRIKRSLSTENIISTGKINVGRKQDCCVLEVPNATVNVTNTLVKHGETVLYSCDLKFSSLFTTATCDNGLLDISKIKCRL